MYSEQLRSLAKVSFRLVHGVQNDLPFRLRHRIMIRRRRGDGDCAFEQSFRQVFRATIEASSPIVPENLCKTSFSILSARRGIQQKTVLSSSAPHIDCGTHAASERVEEP